VRRAACAEAAETTHNFHVIAGKPHACGRMNINTGPSQACADSQSPHPSPHALSRCNVTLGADVPVWGCRVPADQRDHGGELHLCAGERRRFAALHRRPADRRRPRRESQRRPVTGRPAHARCSAAGALTSCASLYSPGWSSHQAGMRASVQLGALCMTAAFDWSGRAPVFVCVCYTDSRQQSIPSDADQ